jgi:hypothetical protein
MKIMEVDTGKPDRLLGLAQFLAGRATDTASKKQISQQAFVKLAQELGINVTDSNLADVIGQPPLSNVLEPLDPATGMITFKGGEKEVTQMPVNKAQDIVAKMAKKANTLT